MPIHRTVRYSDLLPSQLQRVTNRHDIFENQAPTSQSRNRSCFARIVVGDVSFNIMYDEHGCSRAEVTPQRPVHSD